LTSANSPTTTTFCQTRHSPRERWRGEPAFSGRGLPLLGVAGGQYSDLLRKLLRGRSLDGVRGLSWPIFLAGGKVGRVPVRSRPTQTARCPHIRARLLRVYIITRQLGTDGVCGSPSFDYGLRGSAPTACSVFQEVSQAKAQNPYEAVTGVWSRWKLVGSRLMKPRDARRS
jgi:hypothetical protein